MFEKLSAKMLQCANGCADPLSCDYFDAGELKCMRQLLFEGAAAIRTLESKERPAYLPQYELVPRKTHYDLLIRMTPEELATVMAWPYIASPPWCDEHTTCPYISEDPTPCDKCALDWLKQEV